MNKKTDLLITGQQAALLVNVSPPTFYKMSKELSGLAPVPSAGASVVWSLQSVLDWIVTRDDCLAKYRRHLVSKWESEA